MNPDTATQALQDNKQKALLVGSGSFIEFYKNGTLQNKTVFEDIYEGTYFAAISMYMNARCRVNFGKAPFRHSPQQSKRLEELKWMPYSMLSQADF